MYQAFRNAIEQFQPGSASAPILYSTTEANDKGFRALLGRKLKSQSILAFVVVTMVGAVAVGVILNFVLGNVMASAPAMFFFVPWFIMFLYRTTLITVGDEGLDFYFCKQVLGSKCIVDDKMSLPYNKLINVDVKTKKSVTYFTFEFTADGKTHKIKTSVPNKKKNTPEQAENLKRLHNALDSLKLLKS